MRISAISTGPVTHLDHLAPLCSLLDLPLIVVEKEHFDLGKNFYPMIDLQYVPLHELTLEYIARHFQGVIACGKFWALELKSAIQMLYQNELRVIFVPHGYSDKESFLGSPTPQDIALSYEDLGNLRHHFYEEHKEHFDCLAAPYFHTDKKSVLYAPTWESKACPTSFFSHIDDVISKLGKSHNLLIKLHPLLEENHPAHYHHVLGKYEKDATFIENFPPIYPLLEKTDIYLGDYSSIGYDFLHYDRPLFFLSEGGALQQCGEPFSGSLESAQQYLSAKRKSLYTEAFGVPKSIGERKSLLVNKVGLLRV